MHVHGGVDDARSPPSFSAPAVPNHATSLRDRQVFNSSREKFDRLERETYILAKTEWVPDDRFYSSGRSFGALFVNRGVAGRRRALGRHAPLFVKGRHENTGGHGNSGGQNVRLPPENGKAERDIFFMSDDHSPGYSGSPTSEKPAKAVNAYDGRDSHVPNPRFDPQRRPLRSQNGIEGLMSSERERTRVSGSSYVWEGSRRDRDLRERSWSRPEYCRGIFSLPKLGSSRDWNYGDRDMGEGRIDRYSNASSREAVLPDILSRDCSRYDWRSKDRSIFSGLSPWSTTRVSSNNLNRREVGAPSSRLEVPRVVSPPAFKSSVSPDSWYNNKKHASPRKRPRLSWGHGLTKYEEEKTKEEPYVFKKSKEERHCEFTEGECNFEGHSLKIRSVSSSEDNCEKRIGSLISGAAKKGVIEKEESPVSHAASRGLEDLSTSRNVDGCFDSAVASANVCPPPSFNVHDVHVFLESYHRENPSVPKDILSKYVETVEVQIDLVEKEITKLENEYEYGIHVPRERENASCRERGRSWMLGPMVHEEVPGRGSQDVLDVNPDNLLALGPDGRLGECQQWKGTPEGGKPGEDEVIVAGPEAEQSIAWSGEGDQSIVGLEEDTVSHILHSNQKTAQWSLSHLRHLICSGLDDIPQTRRLHGSLEEVDAWKLNAESFLKKREFLGLKVLEERAIASFTEKLLAVKYMAFRERWKAWKQDVQDFHVAHERSYLMMPTMLVGERAALHRFQTNNGLVEDPLMAEQERKTFNPWSDEERKIFLEKYGLFGKDFRKISMYLVNKRVADCIEFYYRNQKTQAFKEVRVQNQPKKCTDVQASDVYLPTAAAVRGRYDEESSVAMEGLALVAEAATALSSMPRDYYTRTSRNFATSSSIEECPGTRLLSPGKEGNKDKFGGKGSRSMHSRAKAGTSAHWNDNERELFMDSLLMYGKDFQSISLHVGSKSEWQCRTFFSKARRRLGLDELVERHNATVEALEVGVRDEVIMKPLDQEDNTEKTVSCGGVHILPLGNCSNASINNLEPDTIASMQTCPMDNLLKQESCITFNGEKQQAMVSGCLCGASTGASHAPYSSVEKSLVCSETLEFKMDPVKFEAEPTLATISIGSDFDGCASNHPRLPQSLPTTTGPVMQRKELCSKAAMETKSRREPTLWTQDEKDKFSKVLKVHGKDWGQLRECLPAKSLTQIKTYIQDSIAKPGFGAEGGNGRVCRARKRKTDDSDSSSTVGQAAAAPLKGPICSGALGMRANAEPLLYTNPFRRIDSINSPHVHSYTSLSPNLGAPQQSYAHPSVVTSQQNLPQPKQALPSLVTLQQPVASVGIQQTHQQLHYALMLPDLAAQDHLHKQPALQEGEMLLQPQLLQWQHSQQLHPQLPHHHHFQQMLGQRQTQSSRPIPAATMTNQLQQQGLNGSSLLPSPTSESLGAAHLLQQHTEFLPSLPVPQIQQLQAFQLRWEQQQQPQQQQQVQAMQSQLPRQPCLTPLSGQQLHSSLMRGAMEVLSGCSEEAGKCQTPSADHLPTADIKLFGQSLLSQPLVEHTGRLSCTFSDQEASAAPSASVVPPVIAARTSRPSLDAVLPGPAEQHPSAPLFGHGSLPGSASCHLGDAESEQQHNSAQEAVARMNERLMKEAANMEDGQVNEAATGSHDHEEQLTESCVGKGASSDVLRPQHDANTNNKSGVQDQDGLLPVLASPQAASQGLPRVLDALVALAEWRLQNANADEFLSQSLEALQRDPVSLVEIGKAGGSVAHIYAGNGDMLQRLKDDLFCLWQSHPQRSLTSTSAHRAEEPRTGVEAGDACGSRGAVR